MWKTEYRCVKCERRMSYHIKMYSHGRCPMCGFKAENAGTIVECSEHAYREKIYWNWSYPFRHTKRVYKSELNWWEPISYDGLLLEDADIERLKGKPWGKPPPFRPLQKANQLNQGK